MSIKQTWDDLKSFFKVNAPKVIPTLNKGLPKGEIVAFEKKWNVELPEDFKTSLEIHNGQPRSNHIHFLVIADSYWLWPIEEIDEECNYIVNICKRKLERIPFAYAGNGDKLYLNISADKSKNGKVNYYHHDGGGGGTVEKSFGEFLTSQYQRMINKEIIPDEDNWFSLA